MGAIMKRSRFCIRFAAALAFGLSGLGNTASAQISTVPASPISLNPFLSVQGYTPSSPLIVPTAGSGSHCGTFQIVQTGNDGLPDTLTAIAKLSPTGAVGCGPDAVAYANTEAFGITSYNGTNGSGGVIVFEQAPADAGGKRLDQGEVELARFLFPEGFGNPVGAFVTSSTSSGGTLAVTAGSQGAGGTFGQIDYVKYFLSNKSKFSTASARALKFKLGAITQIFAFPGGAGGAEPGSAAVMGPDGNLYGTTLAGGMTGSCFGGCGVVYQLTPPTGNQTQWNENVLYTFGSQPAFSDPYASVSFDSAGNVYTTAAFGDAGDGGGVIKLTKQATFPWPLTTIYAFEQGTSTGAVPLGGVSLDSNGNIYGSTLVDGGKDGSGDGTVFELIKPRKNSGAGNWPIRILRHFHGGPNDGANPSGSIVLIGGDLYGTTYGGGNDVFNGKCPGGGLHDTKPGCGVVYGLPLPTP